MTSRLALILLLSVPLAAQTVTGQLEGHTIDTSGAPIAGVKLTARNTESGTLRESASDQSGYYLLSFLSLDTGEAAGFGSV